MNRWAGLSAPLPTKRCNKCNQEKLEGEFHKNASRSSGLQSWCKACNRANAKAQYWRNKK